MFNKRILFLVTFLVFGLFSKDVFAVKNLNVSRSGSITFSPAQTVFIAFTGTLASSTTEADKQIYLRSGGGTFSNLGIKISANTLDVAGTFLLRYNETNGNLSISVTASTTGLFVDNSNTDIRSTDDRIALSWTCGAGTGSATALFTTVTFNPTTNHSYFAAVNANSTTSDFLGLNGASTDNSEITNNKLRVAGNLQKLQVVATANASTTNVTARIRLNATTNGNNSTSITALTTGRFEDTANTDAVVATDIAGYQLTGETTGDVTTSLISISLVPTSSTEAQYTGDSGNSIADGVTTFFVPNGNVNPNATEANLQVTINFDYSAHNLEVNVTTNGTTAASTFDLRKGGASTALTVSITSGTTGYFSDTSNIVTGSSGDLINYRIVNGGGGSLVLMAAGMAVTDTTATSSIKTINGLARASVKTVNGLALASVKTVNGLA